MARYLCVVRCFGTCEYAADTPSIVVVITERFTESHDYGRCMGYSIDQCSEHRPIYFEIEWDEEDYRNWFAA